MPSERGASNRSRYSSIEHLKQLRNTPAGGSSKRSIFRDRESETIAGTNEGKRRGDERRANIKPAGSGQESRGRSRPGAHESPVRAFKASPLGMTGGNSEIQKCRGTARYRARSCCPCFAPRGPCMLVVPASVATDTFDIRVGVCIGRHGGARGRI